MTGLISAAELNIDEIRRYARGSLVAAGAIDILPVPLDDITAAVGLQREDLFDLGDESLPERFKSLLKKMSGRVLGAVAISEKVIYVDSTMSAPRVRWTQAHELGHDGLPWHEQAYFADSHHMLSADTRELLEREANAFAAELVFGLDRFADQANSFAPSVGVALQLSNTFGVSKHAALRRYAQTSVHPVALIVCGKHTRASKYLPVWAGQCESSSSFTSQFGPIASMLPEFVDLRLEANRSFQTLASLRDAVHPVPLELDLDTRRGRERFEAHLFYNQYSRFMLVTRRKWFGRRITALPA